MRCFLAILLSALMVLGGPALGSGTTINGSRTILGKWDASTATQTLPIKWDGGLPEACTAGEVFWNAMDFNGRGLYLCESTDTWQAVGWGVGVTAPTTCEVGQVYFDSDATAGENLLVCSATDTWTTVGIIQTSLIGGAGTAGQIALWVGATNQTSDDDLAWDGTSRLLVTDLTVSNTISGSIDGSAARSDYAIELHDGLTGNAEWGFKLCGITFGMWYDENGDGTADTEDYMLINGGVDLDVDCTADAYPQAENAYGLKIDSLPDSSIWAYGAGGFDFWIKWDVYGNSGKTTPAGGITNGTNVDSNGDGTLDTTVQNVIAGFKGDGSNPQRLAIFPGGYSADPFDYTSAFVFANNASGEGAFYPIISDPNYGTLGSSARADLGQSSYPWRNVYASGTVYSNASSFTANAFTGSPTSDGTFTFKVSGLLNVEADYDNDGTGTKKITLNAKGGTGVTNPQFSLDGSANTAAVDADGDGTPDIRFDGDEPAHGESVTWDATANAVRWAAAGTGSGDDLAVDGTATASTTPNLDDGGDINFAYAAPNITATVKADSVALGTDTTGNYAGSSSEGGAATTATALDADPSDCSTGNVANAIAASGNLSCKTETMGAFTFSFSNLPASGTSNMRPAGVYADGFVRWYTTYAITLKGMTCYVNAAKTGGTLAVTVNNGGSATDITLGTGTAWAASTPYSDTACTSNCNVAADGYINMTAVTASTFAPTTADLQCQVFYVMQ